MFTAIGTPFEPPELHWRPESDSFGAAWRSYALTAISGPSSAVSSMFQITLNAGDTIDLEVEFILSSGSTDVAQLQYTTASVMVPGIILYPCLDNSLGTTVAVGSLKPVGVPQAT